MTHQSLGKSNPSSSSARKEYFSDWGRRRVLGTTGINAVPSSYLCSPSEPRERHKKEEEGRGRRKTHSSHIAPYTIFTPSSLCVASYSCFHRKWPPFRLIPLKDHFPSERLKPYILVISTQGRKRRKINTPSPQEGPQGHNRPSSPCPPAPAVPATPRPPPIAPSQNSPHPPP